MGIFVSMFLVAAGAIMRFAVTVQGHGFNIHTTGVILMIVGAIGAVLSIAFWASWGGFGHYRRGSVAAGPPIVASPPVQQTDREVL